MSARMLARDVSLVLAVFVCAYGHALCAGVLALALRNEFVCSLSFGSSFVALPMGDQRLAMEASPVPRAMFERNTAKSTGNPNSAKLRELRAKLREEFQTPRPPF
eukprot:9492091-Alexandrium_andersonii.AAC.1